MASRSRQYAIGAAGGFPLPLSVADITAVVDAHPSPLPREELDASVFALDAEFMDSFEEKPQRGKPAASAWGDVVAAVNGNRRIP